MAKVIHDNVWGDIEVSQLAVNIIDRPEFQRLHYIGQTGCAFRVFPTAKTSRFEHSVGTYHVTGLLLQHLFRSQPELESTLPQKAEFIRIAALVHDIGHSAYSHCWDKAFPDSHHEDRSMALARTILRELQCNSDEINFVCTLINPPEDQGGPWFTQLVKNKVHGIDVDKLDYMPRDIKAFGLSSDINVNRIITNSRIIGNQLCFCERIKDDLFGIFFTRYRLHREVYSHPKVIEFDLMISEILTKTVFSNEDFCRWTDFTVLLACPDKELVEDWLGRRPRWRLWRKKAPPDLVMCMEVKKVTIRPGFCSEGVEVHPLSQILLYSRKDPHSTTRYIEPGEYNMLAVGPWTEEISFTFVRPRD